MRSKATLSRNTKQKLKAIPPSSDSARDEGPRLLPIDEHSKEPSRLEHYLELADTALGLKRLDR